MVMMTLAWQHNPQGEIHSEKGINFAYLLLIGTSWFVMAFLLVFILDVIVKTMWQYLKG